MSKVISRLLKFALLRSVIGVKIAPFSQPMGSQTMTNSALLARVFPRLERLHASNSDWFVVVFACCDWAEHYFVFGFTTLDQTPPSSVVFDTVDTQEH